MTEVHETTGRPPDLLAGKLVVDKFAEQKARDLAAAEQRIQDRVNRNRNLQAFRKDELIAVVKEQREVLAEIRGDLERTTRDLIRQTEFSTQQTNKLGAIENQFAERQSMVETLKADVDASTRDIRALSALVNEQNDQKVSLEAQLATCEDKVEALLAALVLINKETR